METGSAQHTPVELLESQDYTTEPVPLKERRGPISLGLLWLTMVTGFPSVLAGFDWYKHGITLQQTLLFTILSGVILLAYTVPACWLAAVSGQTYALLSRTLFGRVGSYIVSLNVSLISLAWYGLTAYICAASLVGIYHWNIALPIVAAILAILMAVNNLFGFTGITAFAGYIAAPVLMLGIGIAFFKALGAGHGAWTAAPVVPVADWKALTLVSAFVIGYGAWGNEADYWRYSRPKMFGIVVPLIVSIGIGALVFPITGWLLAKVTGVTDVEKASEVIMQFGYGDNNIFSGLVLAIAAFALNDANLYAAINGVENIRKYSRAKLTIILTIVGAITAAIFSCWSESFEAVTSMSSTILPCATVIMLAEWFIFSKLRKQPPNFATIPDMSVLPAVRWSPLVALLAGSLIGIMTAGLIPFFEPMHVGVCSLQAWLTSLVVYMVLRSFELFVGSKNQTEAVPTTTADESV